jgi:hypothetical protein
MFIPRYMCTAVSIRKGGLDSKNHFLPPPPLIIGNLHLQGYRTIATAMLYEHLILFRVRSPCHNRVYLLRTCWLEQDFMEIRIRAVTTQNLANTRPFVCTALKE